MYSLRCCSRVGTSPNGWTDDEIGFEWFKTIFVPQATERNRHASDAIEQEQAEKRQAEARDNPDQQSTPTLNNGELNLPLILLIYDGHGSHTTLDWIELACANNIILYCLPPHTTHRLQPLDVGCFGPLQIAWFNRCDEILDETVEGMEMKDVVKEYFVARRRAFTKTNISQAWRRSGLRPLNSDLFTASDFAPSHRSSTNCHAPPSFPRMPRVPDLPSDDSVFDPAQFQHIGDSSASESDTEYSHSGSASEGLDSGDSSEGDSLDEGQFERPQENTVNPHQSTDWDSSESSDEDLPGILRPDSPTGLSESEEDVELQDTPTAKYSQRKGALPLLPSRISTPSNHTFPSPPHYTRSKRQSDLPLVSRTQSLSSMSTPSTSMEDFGTDPHRRIRTLQKELEYIRAQRDAAEMHAVFAQRESALWKYRFNKKQEKAVKGRSRRFHTKGRVVTNHEGRQDARQEHEKRREKERKETASKAQKAAKQKEDLLRRAIQGSTREFTGSLASKNKTNLEDLADALGLDIQGTKAVLVARITDHFSNFPRFKEDPRFRGMFERTTRGRKRLEPDDENMHLPADTRPAQRPRLTDTSMDTVTNTYTSPFSNHHPHPSPLPPVAVPPFPPIPVASSSRVRLENLLPQSTVQYQFVSQFS